MTVTQTPRLALTRWSAGSDPLTRAQMDGSHQALEEKVVGFIETDAASRPSPSAANAWFLHRATDTGALSLSTGAAWVDIPTGTISDGTATLTTKGDLLTRDGTGLVRQAVGSNYYPLIADSAQASGMRWGGDMHFGGLVRGLGNMVEDVRLSDFTDETLYLTTSGTVNLDARDYSAWVHTPGGSVTYTFTPPTRAPANQNLGTITLVLKQPSTLRSITWPSSVKWPGGTAPTFAASTTNLLTFVHDPATGFWLAGSPLMDIK